MSGARILLADDDRVVRMMVASGLRDAGHDVIEAANGEDAVRLAVEERPALAILDLRMPGLSGLQAAARLRDETDVPFVVLSGCDDARAVRDAADAGALGYLVKPVDVRQMLPTIEAALDRAAEIRELRASRVQLNTALEQGRETSVAIGIIMARHQLAEREAFELLRAHARRKRRRLAEVAAELVRGLDAVNALCNDIVRPPGES